jgi:hypothetical protein
VGERYKITFKPTNDSPSWVKIEEVADRQYIVPKVMYVPSERNFLSTIKGAFDYSGLPGPLASFAEELKRSQTELNGLKLDLPFNNFSYEYDEDKDVSYVLGSDYKIDLLDASSGLHSLIPLFLVSRNLSMKVQNENVPSAAVINANQSVRRDREVSATMMDKMLTSEEKNKRVEEIFAKYHSKCFINIVEEPEQNLFPTSQRALLNSLLECNNRMAGNKLIVTTHSPYIINYLSIAIEGGALLDKIDKLHPSEIQFKEKLEKVVPVRSVVKSKDVVIYQLNENTGVIEKLPSYEGIPSDRNFLNNFLAEGNMLFDSLLEIEQSL